MLGYEYRKRELPDMFDKQNFQNGEEVIISKLGDEKEYKGIIVGKGLDHVIDFYIIKTDGRPFAP